MKRIVVAFILFVMMMVVVSPASAAQQRSKVEVLYTPTAVYPSETFEVTFKVTSKGDKAEKWQAKFPKSLVAAVEVADKRGIQLSEDTENFVLTFNHKKLKSQNLSVLVTVLSGASGSYSLLGLYNQNGKLIDQRFVDVLVPELAWKFEVPTEVSVGSTFSGAFSVSNESPVAIDLNVNSHFAMYCITTFELLSYPSEAFTGHYFDGVIHQYSWNNYSVQPGETLTWTFQAVAVGSTCGNSADRVFELIDNAMGVVIHQQPILVK